jgi:hypothetical protein
LLLPFLPAADIYLLRTVKHHVSYLRSTYSLPLLLLLLLLLLLV